MKIAVIGAGDMGAWFAHELTKQHQVAVYDVEPSKVEKIAGVRPLKDMRELGAFAPGLLLNAVGLSHTRDAFNAAFPYLPENCILADIASVKGDLPAFYRRLPFPFVSAHPMFGPRFADLELLKGENAIIISESQAEGKEFFREFFTGLGLTLTSCTFAQHDRWMAVGLGLPFLSSLFFAAGAGEKTIPGTSFRRHHQTAEKILNENDDLLTAVLSNPPTLELLDTSIRQLEQLKQLLTKKNPPEIKSRLDVLRKRLTNTS